MAAECPPGNVVAIRMAFWTTPFGISKLQSAKSNNEWIGGNIVTSD